MKVSTILNKFCEKTPISVMARGLIERVLTPEKLDALFERVAEQQYTRELLFSSIFGLMTQVVTKVFPSVNAAYQSQREDFSTSLTSIYNKLNGLDTVVTEALVHDTSLELRELVDEMGGRLNPLLDGYKLKILDGNCIEATHRKLKVLRETGSAALPGKLLVVYEPEYQMATQIVAIEDGHAQERSALHALNPSMNENDVFVMDRNFCTQQFLGDIRNKGAFFIVRKHGKMPVELIGEESLIGVVETGEIYEQWAYVKDKTESADKRKIRQIRLKLNSKTRDGEQEIIILTNLTKAAATAQYIALLYRKRWNIETMFQELESYLESEVNGLGYPKAALFGFGVAVVAYNILVTVKAALRSLYGEEKIEAEVSGYYISGEMSRTYEGMSLIVDASDWNVFRKINTRDMAKALVDLAKKVDLLKYKKHKRGPKKKSLRSKPDKRMPHVSTARLLNA